METPLPKDIRDSRWALPVAASWYETRRVDSAITLIWEPHVHDVIRSNIWHVRGRDRDLLVDTGLGIASLVESMTGVFTRMPIAVATHSHFDHVGGLHEFPHRAIHPAEISFDPTPSYASLVVPPARDGDPPVVLLTALPHADYDPSAYCPGAIEPTHTLEEGGAIDLGDRKFVVLHLPGHSPGSIALWEESTGVLFSGDAIYDGQLFDALPGSNIPDYLNTMTRLRNLPVSVVHSGHGESFGRARLVQLADDYSRTRGG